MSIALRVKIYALAFAAVAMIDAAGFLLRGREDIIDWPSIHGIWVGLSVVSMLLFAFAQKAWIALAAGAVHFAVFALSFLNQFVPFSAVFSYNCMLFNFALFTAYYFSAGRNSSAG